MQLKSLIKKSFVVLLFTNLGGWSLAQSPDPAAIATILRQQSAGKVHPRFLLTKSTSDSLKNKVNGGSAVETEWFSAVKQDADAVVAALQGVATLKNGLTTQAFIDSWKNAKPRSRNGAWSADFSFNGGDPLGLAGGIRESVFKLAFASRMEQNVSQRLAYGLAVSKLMVRANLTDTLGEKNWSEGHLLALPEYAFAHAIAYDWCYDQLTDTDRAYILNKMHDKGLVDYRGRYGSFPTKPFADWVDSGSNWNHWQNAGAIALITTTDRFDDSTSTMLGQSLKSIRYGIDRFTLDDGGWWEGSDYWNVATLNLAYYAAGLESATNTTYPSLYDDAALKRSSRYPALLTGPGGIFSNGHATQKEAKSPQLLWYSKKYLDNDLNYWVQQTMKSGEIFNKHVEALLWYSPVEKPSGYFFGNFYAVRLGRLAVIQNETKKVFFAAKGGLTGESISHSQLDHGDFVFDSEGTRFVTDLQRDSYSVLEAQPGKYTAYRERAEGHNTLVINPQAMTPGNTDALRYCDQRKESATGIISPLFNTLPSNNKYVVFGLSPAYSHIGASMVKRGFKLYNDDKSLLMVDYVERGSDWTGNSTICWQIHTYANVTISADGKMAYLTKTKGAETKKIRVSLRQVGTPPKYLASAGFSTESAKPYAASPAIKFLDDNGNFKWSLPYESGPNNTKIYPKKLKLQVDMGTNPSPMGFNIIVTFDPVVKESDGVVPLPSLSPLDNLKSVGN